jgi:hypothetical protein
MDPRILKAEPYYNNGSNKVFLLLKIYWLLYLEFLQPFFPSGREKSESLFSRERIVGGEWAAQLQYMAGRSISPRMI